MNVRKNLFRRQFLVIIIEFTQGRNPFNVINVGKRLARNQTSEYIRELTVGRSLINVMNMKIFYKKSTLNVCQRIQGGRKPY